MIPSRTQLLVVGGGPAGSSAAWQCAQLGFDVVLVDRAAFPRAKPCAEYLGPEGVRIATAMGALTPTDHLTMSRVAGMEVHTPSGARIRGELAGRAVATHRDARMKGALDASVTHPGAPVGFGIRRELLDDLLLRSAERAGVRVLERVQVTQLLRDAHGDVCGAEVTTADGTRELRADIVIGADGLRSVVAHRLGVAHHSLWPRRLALVTHMRGVTAAASAPDMTRAAIQAEPHGEMHVRHGGYVGLAPVGDGVTNVALVIPRRRAHEFDGDAAGFLDRWLARDHTLAPRFARAERITPVRVTGPFGARARRAVMGSVLLTGDAADFFDPFTGDGMTAALRGSEVLAPCVDAAFRARTRDARRRALLRYGDARRAAFAGKWRVERLIGLAVSLPGMLDRAARVLARDRDLADLFVGVTSQMIPSSVILSPRTLLRLLG